MQLESAGASARRHERRGSTEDGMSWSEQRWTFAAYRYLVHGIDLLRAVR